MADDKAKQPKKKVFSLQGFDMQAYKQAVQEFVAGAGQLAAENKARRLFGKVTE